MQPRSEDARTDEELIAAMNGGDAGAFEVLYYRYRDWVVNLAYRFTGDRECALDVLQETFLYLARKFPGFELSAQLKTFLYPAIRNLSLTMRRKAARYEPAETEKAVEEPAAGAEVGDAGEAMQLALACLSEEHREVLLLRFVDGMSLQEIADAVGIPIGTVKSRLHNGLAGLREHELTKKLFER